MCCGQGLGSGYHLALFLHTPRDRLPVKMPCNPAAAQLLGEKGHWPTPFCSPLLSLPSSCHVSLPLLFWKLWAEYFQMLEYFQICRLTEIHVIDVWKWSRWARHLILCWSNALNFNLCSATCFFYLEQTTTALCTSAHPYVQTYLAMWPSPADPYFMGLLQVALACD